jgi:AraC-like DNA-binding protein
LAHTNIQLVAAQEFAAICNIATELFGQKAVERVFRNHGFSKRLLTEPDLLLLNSEYIRFLEACARQTNQPLFGAIIGDNVPFSDLGTYGTYVTEASSLSESLRRASPALRYHESGSSLDRLQRGSKTLLVYQPATPNVLGSWHQSDGVAAMLINLVRMYEGLEWTPDSIYLVGAKGERQRNLERYFDVPVMNYQKGTKLVCSFSEPLAVKRTRLASEYGVTFADLRKMVSAKPPLSFCGILKNVLDRLVRDGVFEIDQVAAKIALSTRTIQRSLRSEGTTFSSLLKAARQRWALELLAREDLTIGDIADILGYSSKQHFIRAFKTWTGKTPGANRQTVAGRW